MQIRTDNNTLVCYINHQGGRFEELNAIAQRMWDTALSHGFCLQAKHIAGKANYQADALSRPMTGGYNWKLSSSAFRQISKLHGPFSVDAFATAENSQLPRFWSLRPEPEAAATDAFDQTWAGERIYAFPPPLLIPQVVRKAKEEAASVTLLTPVWPTQAWYTLLMRESTGSTLLSLPTPLLTGIQPSSSGAFDLLLAWTL